MRPETTRLLTEFEAIDWFSNLGRPSSLPHTPVSSWKHALKMSAEPKWENLRLMAHNHTARKVCQRNWDRYQTWNPICQELRPEVDAITRRAADAVVATREVQDVFQHNVSWDLLGILLEQEFDNVFPSILHLSALFPIYRSGHFPCGWTGPNLDTIWSGTTEDPIPAGEILFY
jgi:hypothetical protein